MASNASEPTDREVADFKPRTLAQCESQIPRWKLSCAQLAMVCKAFPSKDEEIAILAYPNLLDKERFESWFVAECIKFKESKLKLIQVAEEWRKQNASFDADEPAEANASKSCNPARFCSGCGQKNLVGGKFCSGCGQKL